MTDKITGRAALYLSCVSDWSAPYEIQSRLGDSPPTSINDIRRMLGRLSARGLVKWHSGNNTYRATDEGRKAEATYRSPTTPDLVGVPRAGE